MGFMEMRVSITVAHSVKLKKNQIYVLKAQDGVRMVVMMDFGDLTVMLNVEKGALVVNVSELVGYAYRDVHTFTIMDCVMKDAMETV